MNLVYVSDLDMEFGLSEASAYELSLVDRAI